MASAQQSNLDRRERLRQLALETVDLAKDPYFMRNHLGIVGKVCVPVSVVSSGAGLQLGIHFLCSIMRVNKQQTTLGRMRVLHRVFSVCPIFHPLPSTPMF